MKPILTFFCFLLLVCPGFAKDKQPNVVVLLADDLGWKDIGCYGGPVKTPALDELAANGVRFTDFYAGAAVCGPSRAVLLTGRHHARAGIYGNVIFDSIQKPHLLQREVTLPEVLKKHGYETAHFGKWHLGMPTRAVKKPTPAEHGFDYWFGMNSGAHPSHKDPVNFLRNGKPVGKIEGYSCQIVVDEAISWLDDKRDPEAPFFLNLWFHEPHDRVAAPESIVSQYGDLTDQAAVYSATIDNTDRAIARLLDKLKEVDSLENTLVFYTSDNGSYRGDRNGNLRGRKGSNFEGGIRVPGIWYWPGTIKGGHIEHEPAGVVDLLPTVCGLLGIDKPEGVHLDGSDMSPLLTGRNNEFARHQPLYWHLPSNNPSLAIRQGNYSMVAYRDYEFPRDRQAINNVEKEIVEVLRKANSPELAPWVERTDYFYKKFKNKDAERLRGEFMRLNVFQESWIPVLKSGSYHRFQLFDLAADPTQKVDVSKQYPEVFSRLKRQLLKVNASVMAEAPDWGSADEAPTPSSPNPATSKKPNRPNVVVLLADDLGSKDLGCYGGPVKTPVLDGLAARGVRFTDFHAGAAVCSPSRATLLTGRQNLRTGIYGVLQDHMHDMHLLEREVTIAEVLQKAGYGTAHFGKWHIGMTSGKRVKPSPTEHGFDYWFGLSNGAQPNHRNPTNFMRNGKRVGPMKGYSCQIVVSDAIDWLETRPDPDQPFFLNIWFNEPHSKLAAPDEIVSIYGDLKDEAAIYSATVDNTDRAIGRLVEKLEAMGKLDNTLIIYSSDHGSYRTDRNGGLRGNKGSNFQGGLRSPGIFFWPDGIRGGRIERTPSGSVDLLPTICGLAGIDKPEGVHLDGADLSPLLTEKGTFTRAQPLFWLAPSSGHLATLREGQYTLVGYSDYKLSFDRDRHNGILKKLAELAGIDPSLPNLSSRVSNTTFSSPEFKRLLSEKVRLQTFQEAWIPTIKAGGFSRFALYDLSTDPLQQNDISKQRPEVTERLKKKLLALYKDVMADAPDWLTPEEIAAEKSRTAAAVSPSEAKPNSPITQLLAKIDASTLPSGYVGGSGHQDFVDEQMKNLSREQHGRIGQLWKEKQRIDPKIPNRGASFVKILAFVAAGEKLRKQNDGKDEKQPRTDEDKRATSGKSPNVLFMAIDDLNDWVGCLGGHPQAKTPNIDRLASQGVLFEQAYGPAPLCSPSRTSIMTGLRPSTTGIYGNLEWFRDIPKYEDWQTIPQHFRSAGYSAWAGGKLYHMAHGKFSDPIAWDEQYSTKTGTPFPPKEKRYQHGMQDMFSNKILARLIDWGPIEQCTQETNDWKTANLAAEFLQQEHDKPFFLGCGIFHPHLPWYVPKKYFELHPLEEIQLPARKENDLDDVPPIGRKMAGTEFGIIKEHGQWKSAVQGRLASCSFADACVGHVLDALEMSNYRDNTIVVLWGDHGYDVGQKKIAKSALWEETSRTPLIIRAPGVSNTRGRCKRPVSLVDLYPTLIELCGLPQREDLDGHSLVPLVRNPEAEWPYPAIITHSPRWHGTNHAIRTEQYHYIHYNDGGEELYDVSNDPNQWENLADDPRYETAKKELRNWLPKTNAEHFRAKAPLDR